MTHKNKLSYTQKISLVAAAPAMTLLPHAAEAGIIHNANSFSISLSDTVGNTG